MCAFRSSMPSPVSAEIMKISVNTAAASSAPESVNRRGFFMMSILLSAAIACRPAPFRPSMMRRVSPSTPRGASTTSTTMSASAAPRQAACTIACSSRRFGTKMPGVSTNTICAGPAMQIAVIRLRVVCTFGVTIETLSPTSWLTRVDLPAFGAPTRATKPHAVSLIAAPPALPPPPAARRRASRSRGLGSTARRSIEPRR